MNSDSSNSLTGNILIVDDNPLNLNVLSGMLKGKGFLVRPSLSGRLALQAAEIDPPDLILLDVNMPEMDGYEVCRRLKENEKLKEIPVIFISALSETLDKVKAFQVGGVDFISKPFQFEEVEIRVVTQLKLCRYHGQKEKEQRLQDQLDFLQVLLEAIPVPVFYKNHLGVYQSCNSAYERLYERPQSEIIGKTIFDLMPRDAAEFLAQKDGELLDQDGLQFFESRIISSGVPHDLAIYKALVKGPGMEKPGIVGTLLDITDRKKFEEELRQKLFELESGSQMRNQLTEQLRDSNTTLQHEIDLRRSMQEQMVKGNEILSTTLMSIEDGVISVDPQGMVTLINGSAEKITGYMNHEAVGCPLVDILHLCDPHTNETIGQLIVELQKRDEQEKTDPSYTEPILVSKNGEKRIVSGSISAVIGDDGTNYGYVIVLRDITEKYRSETQFALSKKMEGIGQLATGIAHEINTPIHYVGDNLHFLDRAFARYQELLGKLEESFHLSQGEAGSIDINQLKAQLKIDHYQREIPDAILESLEGIERVRKIVLAIREFAHPSQKEKNAADLNHGIQTTITISRNEWKYCAEMETDLDPDLPLVYCQIDEINQVILNMIINSSHAIQEVLSKRNDSNQKGTIRIATRKQADYVQILLTDSGGGIPLSIRDRIFEPFFTTKEVGKGTGQGLYLAHNVIVKKHAGRISVESTVGIGTTFTIDLPINPVQREE